jgi:tRNA dimethylallyltransferase
VSLDSMQVYRGMDIGTAKPSARDQAAAPHHMIDVADPWEDYSVARFQRAARDAVADVEGRGRRALLVGGTGLYLQAVVDDLRFPGQDPELRSRLEVRIGAPGGLEDAYADLTRRDPTAAARIEPGNARRILRALEVMELTGEPFSASGPGLGAYAEPVVPVRIAALAVPTAETARRIAERFAAMFTGGLVEEVERLAADPRGWSRSARQAIGYREVLEHRDGAVPTLDAARERALTRTRRFARRQRAWFRRDPRITWVDAAANSADPLPALLTAWGAS